MIRIASQDAECRWTVPVARWSAWGCGTSSAAAGESGAPDVRFVEPMLRRRLSSLARMSLKVAHDCAHDQPSVRFVYASRHGELTRTTGMLEALAAGEALSPTAFSLSVLNATPGLFSILRRDCAPATAVAAAESSFGLGLLEASMQLASSPSEPVLLVYADEPAPAIYAQVDEPAHAIALLLASGAPMQIECTLASETSETNENAVASDGAQSLAFLRCLEGSDESSWHGGDRTWRWRRHEC